LTRVVVTGANGFIGLHTVRALLEHGYEVAAVDLTVERVNTILDENLRVYQLDITKDSLEPVLKQGDKILHLAAVSRFAPAEQNPELAIRVNVEGTLRVILAARKCKAERLVFSSTGSVYAHDVDVPIREDAKREPTSIYGLSKKFAEDLIMHYGKQDLRYVILRYGYVYGPGKDWGAIGSFLKRLSENQPPIVYGGQQTNDFVYVDDVVQANLLALETHYTNHAYNIGTGRAYSILDVAKLCCELSGKNLKPTILPPRTFDYLLFVYDITKAKTLLNYEPKWNLYDGVRDMIAKLQANNTQ